ncbi:MAG: DUF4270 family protein [Bacteroidales bacterium]
MKKSTLRSMLGFLLALVWATSCEFKDKDLGQDLLPPGDSIFLHFDTVFDISVTPVLSPPYVTSEYLLNADRIFLAGRLSDTIVGTSRATLVTEFNTNTTFDPAPNFVMDSLVFFLYVTGMHGNLEQEVTYRIYEFQERLRIDTFYYSNYDPEGLYDPVPLAELTTIPAKDTVFEFLIEDQDFLDKWMEIIDDSTYFRNDTVFKSQFPGLYITVESASEEGLMNSLAMSNSRTRMALHYANDSTDVDSTDGPDFRWLTFPINQYSSQKINCFSHDYTGTHLATVLNQENPPDPVMVVQGLAGVNALLSFDDLAQWMAQERVAIASAKLVMDVVDESVSGIPTELLPVRLWLETMLDDGKTEDLYDVAVLRGNQDESASRFGGYLKGVSEGMFYDTTYAYTFSLPLHFQALINGDKSDNRLVLMLRDPQLNPLKVKLWSNLPANPSRIRLEVTYIKL